MIIAKCENPFEREKIMRAPKAGYLTRDPLVKVLEHNAVKARIDQIARHLLKPADRRHQIAEQAC